MESFTKVYNTNILLFFPGFYDSCGICYLKYFSVVTSLNLKKYSFFCLILNS